MSTINENNLTEVEIAPDGRIYLFGASAEMMEILNNLFRGNEQVRQRFAQIKQHAADFKSRNQLHRIEQDAGHE